MNSSSTLFVIAVFTLLVSACTQAPKPVEETPAPEPVMEQAAPTLNSFVAIFEIPATDIVRAIGFYETLFNIEIEQYDIPGMQMGVWPYENQQVTGLIAQGEGYEPSAAGITIYLNAGNDLQTVLDKVAPNGGTVLVPKTPHADGNGYFAIFLDSEGNKMGLNSPN